MPITNPCGTCTFALPFSRQCNHERCTTAAPDWLSGRTRLTYMSIDSARADTGPCGALGILWAPIPDDCRSLPDSVRGR